MNQNKDDLHSQMKALRGSFDRIQKKLENIQTELSTVQSEVASKSSEIESLAKTLRPVMTPTESRERVVTSANEAVQKLSLGKTQDQILGLFLQEVDTFVDRAIVFLNKDGRFTPWKSIGFDAQAIETVVADGEKDPIVRAAQRQRIIYRSESLDVVFPWLRECGEIPETSICVPLVFNDYVPLVLYGDSTSSIALDSLELLSHLTVLILKNHYLQMLLDSQTAPDEPTSEQEDEAAQEESPKDVDSKENFLAPMSVDEVAQRVDVEEPESAEAPVEESPEEVSQEASESEPSPEDQEVPCEEELPAEVIDEEEIVEPEPKPEPEPEILEEVETEIKERPEGEAPEEVPEDQEEIPAGAEEAEQIPEETGLPTDGSIIDQIPAPPFQTDRPTLEIVPDPKEPEVIVPPPDENDRLHTEARRFARLLVSEIKLYNETQVDMGRQEKDLYRRLSRDIDRSREMYEKRAHDTVRVTKDHFHEELVRILASGEEGLLGLEYPGSQVKK